MSLDSGALVRRVAVLEKRVDDLPRPERGWTPVFLAEPYTNANFNGDSFSDVAALTKIENTSWSTTVPADAKALIILAQCRDSGSAAGGDLVVKLYSAAAATNEALNVRCGGLTNDYLTSNQGIVPATDGDIWYTVNASGANTMDIWLTVVGYWT
jgi:hypothetical protein